jgi:predicted membrane channel-forming protein YqfA (hemolysin III family)
VNRSSTQFDPLTHAKGNLMNSIVYLVGAIVIIVALLSFLGLR